MFVHWYIGTVDTNIRGNIYIEREIIGFTRIYERHTLTILQCDDIIRALYYTPPLYFELCP